MSNAPNSRAVPSTHPPSTEPQQSNRVRRACRRVTAKLADVSGQATAEYGLVLLAAAAIAGLLLAWATRTDAVGRIMDAVVASIISDIE